MGHADFRGRKRFSFRAIVLTDGHTDGQTWDFIILDAVGKISQTTTTTIIKQSMQTVTSLHVPSMDASPSLV